jgi:hypothetical protein
MKKRFKNFCAGFFLTMLIPGFIGGQLLSRSSPTPPASQSLAEGMPLPSSSLLPDQPAHLMDEALCILP